MAEQNQPPHQQQDSELEALLQKMRTQSVKGTAADGVPLFFDGFLCRMLSYPDTAKVFFEYALRKEGVDKFADVLAGSTLALAATRQVNDALRQGHRDLTFWGVTGRKEPSEIRLEVEVTSTNDHRLAARMTAYHAEGGLLEAETKVGGACSLALALSLLINAGPNRLTVSNSYQRLSPGYKILGEYGLRHDFPKWDIMEPPIDEILGIPDPRAASCLGMLRYANAPGEYGKREIYRIAEATGGDPEIAKLAVLPLVHRLENDYRDEALQAWNEAMGSDIVDSMWEEAKAEGAAEGEAKGMAKLLLQQVQRRFADISEQRKAQVRSATLEQLQEWADRVLDAPDIDSVFGGQAKQQPQG